MHKPKAITLTHTHFDAQRTLICADLKEEVVGGVVRREGHLHLAQLLGDWRLIKLARHDVAVEPIKLLATVVVHAAAQRPRDGKQHGRLHKKDIQVSRKINNAKTLSCYRLHVQFLVCFVCIL